jgi:co-chaperonin GroES (HSP10)
MKLKPFGTLILIKVTSSESDAKTQSGIIMPDTVKHNTPLIAEVLSVGFDNGKGIQAGDTILLPRDASYMPLDNIIPDDDDGATYRLILPNVIIGVLTD